MSDKKKLVVIGGGSGGLAAAKEASKLGLDVFLFDFVKPTFHGTKWGIGGTCVNVGCIPKKLMHYAGILGAGFKDSINFGWETPNQINFVWENLVKNIQNYIKQLNFSYRVGLRMANVTYINSCAMFKSPTEIEYIVNGKKEVLPFDYCIIAVGGRPVISDSVPGVKEYCITSDDLFSLPKSPGKTLIVGGSYIALECAGFLKELHCDVTVCVRSILLRGFDRQCSEKIKTNMMESGINFMFNKVPIKVLKKNNNLCVTFSDESCETYETVLYAIGRRPSTEGLAAEVIGLHVLENGKLIVNDEDETNVKNIFAIGDVVNQRVELTPVAIKSGEYLARRIANKSSAKMDYLNIPTTIFTPYEYGCVGYSQELAEQIFGKENIEVYLFEFSSVEIEASHRKKHLVDGANEFDNTISPPCFSKLVCNKLENERVIGFHFIGPNAGEVCQGFSLGVKLGAKKSDFDDLVGIHPTSAESFCAMTITQSSNESYRATGGCGGGKCG